MKSFTPVLLSLGLLCLGCHQEPSVERLIQDLEKPERGCAAAEALGTLGDTRAVAPLIACLKDKDENVRQWSLTALSKLHDAAATDILVGLLRNPRSDVRRAVVDALGNIGGEAVIPFAR